MKLLVLDGNSIVNRAFYGIKMLTTKDGRYTNALVGFMNILLKLEARSAAGRGGRCLRPEGAHLPPQNVRRLQGAAQGHAARSWPARCPCLKQLLADLGYRMVTCEGYEADDILGTLSDGVRGARRRVRHRHRRPRQPAARGRRTRTVLLAGTSLGKSVTVEHGRGRRAGKIRRDAARSSST